MKALGSHEITSVHCGPLSPNPSVLKNPKKKEENISKKWNDLSKSSVDKSEFAKEGSGSGSGITHVVSATDLSRRWEAGASTGLRMGREKMPRARSMRRSTDTMRSAVSATAYGDDLPLGNTLGGLIPLINGRDSDSDNDAMAAP